MLNLKTNVYFLSWAWVRGIRDGTPVTAMLSPRMSDCSVAI